MNDNKELTFQEYAEKSNTLNKIKDKRLLIFVFFIYFLIVIVGIFGNSINIIIFMKEMKYNFSRPYQFFLTYLAWIDLFTCCISIPITFFRDTQRYFIPVTNPNVCWFLLTILYCFPWASTNTLLFISIQQFFAVVKPHFKIKFKTWIIITITYSILITGLGCLYSSKNLAVQSKHYCYPMGNHTKLSEIVIKFSFFLTIVIVIISFLLYTIMFYKLKHKNNFVRDMEKNISSSRKSNQNKFDKQKRNLIRNMLVCFYLIVIYLLITIPIMIMAVCLKCDTPSLLYNLVYLNNIVNFFVYIIKIKTFREKFHKIIRCKCH